MAYLQPRQIAQLNGLTSYRERARDYRLRGDDRRGRRQTDQRIEAPFGRQAIKRVLEGTRIAEQHRSLSEIIEQERREDEPDPGRPQRIPAKMPHIGVEGFGAGHGEENRSQHEETAPRRIDKQRETVDRIDRQEDARVVDNAPYAEQCEHREPHQHYGSEESPDRRRSVALHQKQTGEENDRNRNNVGIKKRRRHFEALHRAQHRDRGSDDPVAVKQRGADQPRPHDPQVSLMCRVGPAQHQRGQRQQPALAAVVGPHDDEDVFDHDDQHQGPNDERERAENRVLTHVAEIDQRLPDGIERRRADVAEYDAECSECQARTGTEAKLVPPCGGIEHQGENL